MIAKMRKALRALLVKNNEQSKKKYILRISYKNTLGMLPNTGFFKKNLRKSYRCSKESF